MGVDLPRLEAGHLPSKSSSFLYTRRISSYPHVLSEIMLVDMLHSVNSVTLLCTVAPCESVTFGAEKADPSVGDPRVSHHRSITYSNDLLLHIKTEKPRDLHSLEIKKFTIISSHCKMNPEAPFMSVSALRNH